MIPYKHNSDNLMISSSFAIRSIAF
jgi:hypothetical protein